MPEALLTHVCRKNGSLKIAPQACELRRFRAGRLGRDRAALQGYGNCLGCQGPVELERPVMVSIAPLPPRVDKKAGLVDTAPAKPPKPAPKMDTPSTEKVNPAPARQEKKPMANRNPNAQALRSPEVRAKAAESRQRNREARKQSEAGQEMAKRLAPMLKARRDELAAAIADPDQSAAQLRTLSLNLVSMLDATAATGALPGWDIK